MSFFDEQRYIKMLALLQGAPKDRGTYEKLLDELKERFKQNPNDPVTEKIVFHIRKKIWPKHLQDREPVLIRQAPICLDTFDRLKHCHQKLKGIDLAQYSQLYI